MKSRNHARYRKNWLRAYGSEKRVRFVKSLPCLVNNAECSGPIENAHIENGGMGRKADADKIVPLCQHHHREQHAGPVTFVQKYTLDLPAAAARVDALFQERKAA